MGAQRRVKTTELWEIAPHWSIQQPMDGGDKQRRAAAMPVGRAVVSVA